MLSGKKVLLGVSASIAAYKSAFIVRELIKAGAEVKVILTPAARDFVTPLTLSTLSKNPVLSSFTHEDDENEVWNNHVDLGLWADLFLIAPATANTLAKMASGEADNLLVATYLSAKCPVYVAPAMDLDMYQHGSTKANLETLKSYGNKIIAATSGELASGLHGEGRLAEPQDIVQIIQKDLAEQLPWAGKIVLITAGPTYEAIDPVRFIGNYSSGKMGFSLARVCADRGAYVHLISGPTALTADHANIKLERVKSAEDMNRAAQALFPKVDIAIASAAVADYRPKEMVSEKIKKDGSAPTIELVENPDILAEWGRRKEKQILVGFALETTNEEANAKVKLAKKNLDLIVLNSLRNDGAGFGHDTNQVTLFDRNNKRLETGLKSKMEIAQDIAEFIDREWL